jgi:hypothetical protein
MPEYTFRLKKIVTSTGKVTVTAPTEEEARLLASEQDLFKCKFSRVENVRVVFDDPSENLEFV